MLRVPRLQTRKSDAIGVKLTVSRVSNGAIEVAVSTPGRLKVDRPGECAKPATPAPRRRKAGR